MAPRKSSKAKGPTPVKATVHQDKRTNIPTADARDFVPPEAEAPKKFRVSRHECSGRGAV